MAYAPPNPRNTPKRPTRANDRPVANTGVSDEPALLHSAAEHPRLIEEHHIVGPHGEDEIEATDEQGRRWYHLRPEPRGRADFVGFNYTWWLVIFVLFILLMSVGHGTWGY